jgi:hypothetical protein
MITPAAPSTSPTAPIRMLPESAQRGLPVGLRVLEARGRLRWVEASTIIQANRSSCCRISESTSAQNSDSGAKRV